MTEARTTAVCISGYSIDNSPSLINLIDLLSRTGRVDVYLLRTAMTTHEVLSRKTVRVLDFSRKPADWAARRRMADHYDVLIGVDPHGFAMCRDLFPEAAPFYYSLELYMSGDHAGLDYPEAVRRKERAEIHRAAGLIIQSEEKDRLFRADYGLSDAVPTFILPVTYRGEGTTVRSDLIRRRFGIGEDKAIALHLGGIAQWFSCAEIAAVFSGLRDWVLFFQGYADKSYARELARLLDDRGIDNVVITDRVYDRIEDVDEVIRSCDVGIAWYNDISVGFRTAGRSSGKIPAYMRFGLPVVAKAYESTRSAIGAPGAGICVDDYLQIPGALARIRADYAGYSANALAEYERTYRFEKYGDALLAFLGNRKPSAIQVTKAPTPEETLAADARRAQEEGLGQVMAWIGGRPGDGEVWIDLAACFWHAGDDDRAWESLDAAERLGAAGWRADWYRLLILRDTPRRREAANDWGRALAARIAAALPDFEPAGAAAAYFDGQDALIEDFFRFNEPRSRIVAFFGADDGPPDARVPSLTAAGWQVVRLPGPLSADAENIDLLLLETGASALNLLDRFDFNRSGPQLVAVDGSPGDSQRQALTAILTGKGYRIWHEDTHCQLFRAGETVEAPNFWRIRTLMPLRPDPSRKGTSAHHFNWDRLMENHAVDDFLASDELWGAHQDADNPGRRAWRKFLARQAEAGPVRVLEIGFGSGIDYRAAEAEGLFDNGRIDYHGADVTEKFLENARQRFSHLTPHAIDGYSLPFDDHSFDVVYLRHVFEHQIHYKWLLGEILRVCRKTVFVNFFIPLAEAADDRIDFDGTWYHNTYSRERFEAFVRERGFSIQELTRFTADDKTDQLILLTPAGARTAETASAAGTRRASGADPRLHIVHTVEYYHPHLGGAELVVQQISERLARRGHRVTVATTALADRKDVHLNGVDIAGFAVKGAMGRRITGPDVDRYRRFLVDSGADVVLNYAAQQWATDLAFETLDATAGRRVNIIAPCGYSALAGPERLRWPTFADYFQRVIPAVLPRYAAAVYHSERYQDYAFAEIHGFTNSVVIPNGVDTEAFGRPPAVDFREKYGIRTPFLFLCVANYLPGKGQERVVECFRHMGREDATMVFIGREGGERRRLEAQAGDLPVLFLHDIPREDTVAAFHAADLFLFGSHIEAAPLVIIEAMAAGTPFVSTDCGNVAEMRGGVVCAPEAMAGNANRLMDDAALRSALAQEGRLQVSERFNWETVTDRYEELYLRLHHARQSGAEPSSDTTTTWRRRLAALDRRLDAVTVDVPVYLDAARLLLEFHQPEEARKYIEDALELDPDHAVAKDLLHSLEASA